MESSSVVLHASRRTRRDALDTQKRVAFYIRVSTEEQAENPEGSVKNQEERLKDALRSKVEAGNAWKHSGTYCDAGRSGKDMNRLELKRLLGDIEAGLIDVVMMSELSRLSRSIKDFSNMWEFLQTHGCAFMSLRENFDTSSAAGEMMLYSIANFAQFERRQTSERVSANFLARARRGLWNGGVLPIGYEPDPDHRGSLRIVDNEARIVRAAFQALLDHGSVSVAAKWLNSNDYFFHAPLRAGGFKPRNKHFTYDSLYKVLSTPAYAGIRQIKTKSGTEGVRAVWPPIVEVAMFERAQAVLAAGKGQKPGRQDRYPYLLSTRVVCGECGRKLIGVSAHGSTTKVPYYGHGNQQKKEQTLEASERAKVHRCTPYRVSGKKLEERVWQEVVTLIEKASHRMPIFQALSKLGQSTAGEQEIKRKEAEILATSEKLSNLARRIADLPSGVPAQSLYDEMKRLDGVKLSCEAEIKTLSQKSANQRLMNEAQYERLLTKLKSQLADVSPEAKRRIFQALVHQVVVTQDGFKLRYFVGQDQIKEGEAIASPSISLPKKISVQGSSIYLNGGANRNRTCNKALGKLRYIHLTMAPQSLRV